MISIKLVLKIHFNSIKNYGGKDGVRDMNLLESTINRPYATFDGKDLYPTVIKKSAAVLESILINHPFNDGNKRTPFSTMQYMLFKENIVLKAKEEELYNFIISIAEGKEDIDKIIYWLKNNTTND